MPYLFLADVNTLETRLLSEMETSAQSPVQKDVEPSLIELAIKHGTDKYGTTTPFPGAPKLDFNKGHKYAGHYDFHFTPYRHRDITVLEIGVGGFQELNKGGESLRMWKEYFPKGQVSLWKQKHMQTLSRFSLLRPPRILFSIYEEKTDYKAFEKIVSMDYYDKTQLQEDRIRIYHGSQDDPALLQRMHKECGPFDLIIDDGSHKNAHVIASLKTLFPLLKIGGIYAIEDLQTSYWKVSNGSSTELSSPTTSMGFLKCLIDCLNHAEFDLPGYKPTYFDQHVVSMHFYHNLAFIYKGHNDEGSNILEDNRMPKEFAEMTLPEWMK